MKLIQSRVREALYPLASNNTTAEEAQAISSILSLPDLREVRRFE